MNSPHPNTPAIIITKTSEKTKNAKDNKPERQQTGNKQNYIFATSYTLTQNRVINFCTRSYYCYYCTGL